MPKEADVDALVSALEDTRMRSRARRELERLGEAPAAKLLRLAGNPEAGDNARWAAISLLGKCRYRPAVPTLAAVLKDSPSLRRDARRALRAIAGVDLGDDPEAWLAAAEGSADISAASPSVPPAGAAGTQRSGDAHPLLALVREAVGDVARDIAWEEPATVCATIAPGAAEPHEIRVSYGQTDRMGRPLVTIHAEAGLATPSAVAVMFRHNVTVRYGNYEVEERKGGTARAVLRYRTSPDALAAPFLREVMLGMTTDLAQVADELGHADRLYPWRATRPSEIYGESG